MSILIRNGRIITDTEDYFADIYIENDKITAIGAGYDLSADREIDATGMLVIPGGIDAHTHLDMPMAPGLVSSDDFLTGTRAAAFGGTTTIIDFPTQERGKSMAEALAAWHQKAEGKAVIDYGFHMIVTDIRDGKMNEFAEMIHEGITSFKLFMAYPHALMLDDGDIFRVMQQAEKLGALVTMHAENGGAIDVLVQQALAEGKTAPIYHALTRPARAEGEAVHRTIALAEMAGIPVYIVHLSTADGLHAIAEARDRGLPVFAETCPQYLFLSVDDMKAKEGFEAAKYVFTPPLRERVHQDQLWGGIEKNRIQVVATDHCPFCMAEQKERGRHDFSKIPNGAPGIEHRLQLLYHGGVNKGRISLNRWVELSATAPAKLFGMYPKKGTIALGSDADIVIWDPDQTHIISADTHHMNVDYSLYEGYELTGNVDTVISRGQVIIEKDQFTGQAGRGQYLKRSLFAL